MSFPYGLSQRALFLVSDMQTGAFLFRESAAAGGELLLESKGVCVIVAEETVAELVSHGLIRSSGDGGERQTFYLNHVTSQHLPED